MTRELQPDHLNIKAFAKEGRVLALSTPLQKMERLAGETQELPPEASVNWEARAELRESSSAEPDIWLHVAAEAAVPLTCQRCMTAVITPLQVDQWYRFVATEEIAMAEDDQAEEDLLVLEPQFDLLGLLEDELLMALPLVPMHEQCPAVLAPPSGDIEVPDRNADKPNPFAVLAQLRKKAED